MDGTEFAGLARDAVTIAVDGARLAPPLARAVTSVLVRQALGAPAALELDIADPPADLAAQLRAGSRLTASIMAQTLFEGTLAATTHSHDAAGGLVVSLRAYDALQQARQRRQVRALEQVSAASLGATLASELGLEFACAADPPVRPLLLQHGQSDLAVLALLAAEAGLYPVVSQGQLTLVALDGTGEERTLRLGRELLSAELCRSNETALRRVELQGWNAATLSAFRQTASTARQDADDMQDCGMAPDENTHVAFLLNRLADSADTCTALAQAWLDRAAASQIVATGCCAGDPALAPGRPVRLTGTAADPGRLVLTETVHRIDAATGYTVAFSTAPPLAVRRNRTPVVTHGEVSATSDPDGLGRCRVALTSFGKLQTGWLQVLVPGAGKGKGLAVLPEPGDGVMVLLPDGDPAQGCVLGGLYGEQALPRGAAAQRDRPFVLRTGGGQGLELGRDTALARLSTSGGSLLELTPRRMRMAAATDLLIEAPGKVITIRADAVRFEQG